MHFLFQNCLLYYFKLSLISVFSGQRYGKIFFLRSNFNEKFFNVNLHIIALKLLVVVLGLLGDAYRRLKEEG